MLNTKNRRLKINNIVIIDSKNKHKYDIILRDTILQGFRSNIHPN